MKCIDFIKEESGRIFIGNCEINEDPKSANEKLQYLRDSARDETYLGNSDIDYVNCSKIIEDSKICSLKILSDHCFFRSYVIREMRLCIRGQMDEYPYHVIADFEDFIDSVSRSPLFRSTTTAVHPQSYYNYISIESPYCELEVIWSKKNYTGIFFLDVILTPSHNNLGDLVYDKELVLNKNARRMGLKLGKSIKDLADSELEELYTSADIENKQEQKPILRKDLSNGLFGLFVFYWETEEASEEERNLPEEEEIRAFLNWCRVENWEPLMDKDKRFLIENGYFPLPTSEIRDL